MKIRGQGGSRPPGTEEEGYQYTIEEILTNY
jgi:hypothetical protein